MPVEDCKWIEGGRVPSRVRLRERREFDSHPSSHSFIVRHWAGIGRPGDRVRTVLAILTVGLGVGVVLAIQLANRSAIQSFESSLVEIGGRANLSIRGAGGVDELLLPRFREVLGPQVEISPAVEAVAVVPSTRETLRILGTDILQDSPVRETHLEQAELFSSRVSVAAY